MGRNEMVLLRENVYSKSEKRERYYWYSDKFEPVPHIFFSTRQGWYNELNVHDLAKEHTISFEYTEGSRTCL